MRFTLASSASARLALRPGRKVSGAYEGRVGHAAGSELEPLPSGVLDRLRQVSTSTVAAPAVQAFGSPSCSVCGVLGVRSLSQVASGSFRPVRRWTPSIPTAARNTLEWEAI